MTDNRKTHSTQSFEEGSALVARIRSGDPIAEDALVTLFHGRVLALIRRRTRDPEAARELANDAMLAVVFALRAGRLADATRLRAFVWGTAVNLTNNYFRKRRGRPSEEPLPPDLTGAVLPDALVERERLAAVHHGLSQLQIGDRRILLMTLVDGLKPREIARDLGLTTTVVRRRKCRALSRLIASTRTGGGGD